MNAHLPAQPCMTFIPRGRGSTNSRRTCRTCLRDLYRITSRGSGAPARGVRMVSSPLPPKSSEKRCGRPPPVLRSFARVGAFEERLLARQAGDEEPLSTCAFACRPPREMGTPETPRHPRARSAHARCRPPPISIPPLRRPHPRWHLLSARVPLHADSQLMTTEIPIATAPWPSSGAHRRRTPPAPSPGGLCSSSRAPTTRMGHGAATRHLARYIDRLPAPFT